MKFKTVAAALTFALAGGFAGVSWRLADLSQQARIDRASLLAATAEARAHAVQLEKSVASTEENRARIAAELEALRKQTDTTAPEKPAVPNRRSAGSILEIIRHEPDAEVFFLEQKRSELAATYGPLMRMLGLSPADIEKFNAIHIRHAETRMDLEDVLRTKGKIESGAAVAKLQLAAAIDYENQQRALLGDVGFQRLKDYERTASLRGMISAIAGVAAVEHVPFSATQADELVKTAAELSEKYRNGGLALGDVDWIAFEARARSILTPEQFVVMSTMDPGPTRAGFIQTRMYTLADQAAASEARVTASSPAASPSSSP